MSGRYNYDHQSGQVFTESSIRAPKEHGSDWIGELKSPSLYRRAGPRNRHGARRLQDMARTQVARNMRGIMPEHLKSVPWAVAEKIWEEVIAIRGESFHAWRVMASSHGDRFDTPIHRYYIDIKRPPLPFPSYFKGITSSSFLVCLRISPKNLDRADLVNIAKISNLAVLDLSDSLSTVDLVPSNFDERIMRVWSELAHQEGAFAQLRALLFGWQPAISTWIFKYLHMFPALSLVVTTACPKFGQSNRKDWEPQADSLHWEARHAKRSVQLVRTIISDENFYFGAISSILFNTNICGIIPVKKPVLECLLGGPPPWENVFRDFPKATQTVWLEKKTTASKDLKASDPNDQSKRCRDVEEIGKDNRLPPLKRPPTQMRSKVRTVAVAELLGDLANTA